jgi:hypothetical protein
MGLPAYRSDVPCAADHARAEVVVLADTLPGESADSKVEGRPNDGSNPDHDFYNRCDRPADQGEDLALIRVDVTDSVVLPGPFTFRIRRTPRQSTKMPTAMKIADPAVENGEGKASATAAINGSGSSGCQACQPTRPREKPRTRQRGSGLALTYRPSASSAAKGGISFLDLIRSQVA